LSFRYIYAYGFLSLISEEGAAIEVEKRYKKGESFPDCKECADKERAEWQKESSDIDMPLSLYS